MRGSHRRIDFVPGTRFGRLVVQSFAGRFRRGKDQRSMPSWNCLCDCGNSAIIPTQALVNGSSRSCRCLFNESNKAGKATRHGKSGTGIYMSWCSMINRCHNPTNARWPDYGGRGISVCDRWRARFEHFYDDVGDRPSGTSLDRIDNDGNYEPDNVRWATPSEQNLNRRMSYRLVDLDDQPISLKAVAHFLGIGPQTAKMMLHL